jgi:hypothetical protein
MSPLTTKGTNFEVQI